MSAEEDFHRGRTMFVWLPIGLRIALPFDHRSHTQWFEDEHWHFAIEKCPRGFWDTSGLYVYKGHTFDEVHHDELNGFFKQVVHYCPDHLPVYSGMNPGPVGERWLPRAVLSINLASLAKRDT